MDQRWRKIVARFNSSLLLGAASIGCGSSDTNVGFPDEASHRASGGASAIQNGASRTPDYAVGGRSAESFAAGGHSAVASATRTASARQPVDWDEQLRIPLALDIDPDPNVFETTVEAKLASTEINPGTHTEMWTYDGTIPGRLILAKIGDRVVVHFKNQLPEPTTMHWHGVRLPNAMDGVPDISQPAVATGQNFTYDFVVPDASLFWYHPHVSSAAQVGFGLYGPILVTDPDEPALGDELVLVLSDASVNAQGKLAPADESGDFGTMFGREGNVLLVNGKVKPRLQVRSGLLQRWRLVNAARSRYYQLAIAGHRFRRIGGDGGLIEQPLDSDMVVLAPAERADVLLVPEGATNSELSVRSVAFDRGFGTTVGRPDEDLFYLHFVGTPQSPPETLPSTSRAIEPLQTEGATEVNLELTQVDNDDGPLRLGITIDGMHAGHADPISARPGETQIWTIANDPRLQFAHPFHLHGFFFQPLDDQGHPVRPLEWKDTFNVPVKGTRRVAIRFDDRPGTWMFHCHILDHADAGMMGMLELAAAQH